jgi:hypothetical protein
MRNLKLAFFDGFSVVQRMVSRNVCCNFENGQIVFINPLLAAAAAAHALQPLSGVVLGDNGVRRVVIISFIASWCIGGNFPPRKQHLATINNEP